MEIVEPPAAPRVNAQVIRIRRDDGGEDRIHLFLDADGFLTNEHGLEKLVEWKRKKQGLVATQVNLGSGVTVLDPDAITKRDIRLFTDATPCWFPECEELRQRYKLELADLEKEITEHEGRDCSGCEKGPLLRKYMKLAREAQQ